MKNIINVGFRKSGNTWFGLLLSYYFNAEFCDAYLMERQLKGQQLEVSKLSKLTLDYRKHDVFQGKQKRSKSNFLGDVNAIIKSHELPEDLSGRHPLTLRSLKYDRQIDCSVLIVREPKDVAVSYFFWECFRMPYHRRSWRRYVPQPIWYFYCYQRHFNRLARQVAQDWSDFNIAWLSHDPFIARYEDLLSDPVEVIRRLTDHCGFVFDEIIASQAVSFCDFSNLARLESQASRKAVKPDARFFRKGTTGQWKQLFPEDKRRQFDRSVSEIANRFGYDSGLARPPHE